MSFAAGRSYRIEPTATPRGGDQKSTMNRMPRMSYLPEAAAFSVVFVGVAVGVVLGVDDGFKWVFAPIAGVLGVGCLTGAVGAGLGCCDVQITGDRWRVHSGWWGLRGAAVESDAGEVRRIGAKHSTTVSSGGAATKKWNHLFATLQVGRRLILVRSLLSRSTERRLLETLRRRAGLQVE